MSEGEPYGPDVARIYDLIVYGRQDAEEGEAALEFLDWAFRDVCAREVRQVLDVGCGTGPYLIPLARAGYDLTGLDNSPAMLDECRAKLERRGLSAELVRGDMEDLPWSERFDAVLCTGSVICYLLEAERIVAALEGFLRALRPGGLLVLENDNFLAEGAPSREGHAATYAGDTLKVAYEDRRSYDAFASVFHIQSLSRVTEGGRSYEVRSHERLRVMTAGELSAYLGQAGFTGVTALPGYDRRAWAEPSTEHMVFLALRPAGERTGFG